MKCLPLEIMPRPRLLLAALTSLALVAAATGLLRHYHIGVSNDGDVAEWAAATGRGPEECLRIIPIDIFPRPTAEQIRSSCVRRYAELTHDPSACELLLPSDYGRACVGGATRTPPQCELGQTAVSWREGGVKTTRTYLDCQKEEAAESGTGAACCHIAFVALVRSQNDCSPLQHDQSLFDECQYQLAFKNRDPDTCAIVKDDNTRTACLVEVRALRQNPSICPDCTPPVESVEDLR